MGECQDRQLLALEEVLYHDLPARLAKGAFGEHGAGRPDGLIARRADHHALAGGEARRFHDERLDVPADVGERGVERVKRAARGGGHAGASQHLLRERLRGLDPRARLARSEHRAAGGGGAQPVGEPGGEWSLGANDGEVDAVVPRGRDEVVDGGSGDREIGAELRGAGVTGGGEHRRVGGGSEEHTSELQSLAYLVCRLLLEKKKKTQK